MNIVPLALACGHVVTDWAWFQTGSGEEAVVECPEGCGMQRFVVEPHEGEATCLCDPGHHVCGEITTTIIDLGEVHGGDVVEIDLRDENGREWPDG